MEDITYVDYAHAKKKLKKKKLREYHDLYVQDDTLLLPDFRNMSLKIYELDPAKKILVPGLAWQAPFKKTKVKLDPFNTY